MNTQQLENILSQNIFTKDKFLGVFPSDHLPSPLQSFPCCFIANVDESSEPGSHWVAFYVTSRQRIEFFDSYGRSPETFPNIIWNYVKRFPIVEFNPQPLQSINTAVCGHYAIFYIYSRCRGLSMKQILSPFVSHHISNDVKVYNFVTHRFRIKTSFYQ